MQKSKISSFLKRLSRSRSRTRFARYAQQVREKSPLLGASVPSATKSASFRTLRYKGGKSSENTTSLHIVLGWLEEAAHLLLLSGNYQWEVILVNALRSPFAAKD